MSSQLWSDRVGGPVPRNSETLPDATALGLVSLVRRRIDGNWLAPGFPEHCPDGNGVTGTDTQAVYTEIAALIPAIEWLPSWSGSSTDAVLDLVEYVGERVAEPTQGLFHSYFRHHELSFDARKGRMQFREDVNQFLSRGGTVFEMNTKTQVERVGAPETHLALSALMPSTGDATLDDLIKQGRDGYLSRHASDRATAVEKLWDAFERLKTIDEPSDKKNSVALLLAKISDADWRNIVEAEMRALTDLGNSFRIGQVPGRGVSVIFRVDLG